MLTLTLALLVIVKIMHAAWLYDLTVVIPFGAIFLALLLIK